MLKSLKVRLKRWNKSKPTVEPRALLVNETEDVVLHTDGKLLFTFHSQGWVLSYRKLKDLWYDSRSEQQSFSHVMKHIFKKSPTDQVTLKACWGDDFYCVLLLCWDFHVYISLQGNILPLVSLFIIISNDKLRACFFSQHGLALFSLSDKTTSRSSDSLKTK